MMDALPPTGTFHPCPAPSLPPFGPPRQRSLPAMHSRVLVIPDGRMGTVVGTRGQLRNGQMTTLGYQIWFDGTERHRSHPLFTADMLEVVL